MAGFSFLGGPTAPDPNSLPALLRQRMMSPGLVPGPVGRPQLTSGFRAPAVQGMAGMSLPAPLPQQDPRLGFNVADVTSGLESLLRVIKPAGENPADPAALGRTKGDADLGGYTGSPPTVDVGNGVRLPSPNAPVGAGAGGAGPYGFLGSISDFLMQWSPQLSANGQSPLNAGWENFHG